MPPKINKAQALIRELVSDFRWHQLFVILCLMVLSTLFVHSATYRGGGEMSDQVRSQLQWFGIGLAAYFLVSLMDYHWICRKGWVVYAAMFLMLVYLFLWKYLPDLGIFKRPLINGARRWISVKGSFMIQPSEFAKLAILLVLPYYLSKCRGELDHWGRLAFTSLMVLVPAYMIHKQPDLGTAIVVVALCLMLLFLAGAPLRFFAILGVVAALGLGVVAFETHRYIQFRRANPQAAAAAEREEGQKKTAAPPGPRFKSFLFKDYQLKRIVAVVAPGELDPLVDRWNIHQSLIAIGSGQLYGKGWLKGDVTHGGYLPRTVSLTDFIFAVFSEETGFAGGAILAGLYAVLLLGGLKIALKASDPLGTLLAGGAVFLIFFHVFVNMGMTLGILPVVGVPLPLMSYGGSFVLVCMVALGLLQSVWLHRKPY